MRHGTTHKLFAYWNEVRGDRLAPQRFDIEPGRIGELLPETLIIEHTEDAVYRFRLAGTRISERFGGEFRGRPLLDLFSTEEAAVVARTLDIMARQGAVGLFHIHSSTLEGSETLSELILLPLVHGPDHVDRYLGAWSIEPREATTDGSPYLMHAILDYELIWPRGRPSSVATNAAAQSPIADNVRYARIVRQDRRQFLVYDGGRSN
jgi:hypothetical protein